MQVMSTVGHKSHDPFHVFLMEVRVMSFVAHCTPSTRVLVINLREHSKFESASL